MESFLRTDCIHDSRRDFSNLTFSGYKKNQVLQQLEKSIINSQIEQACHWSIELVVSGHYEILFEILTNIYCKAININNPKFPSFLLNQFKKYLNIAKDPVILSETINLRNNHVIRQIFAESVLYLSLSKKTHVYTLPKIKPEDLNIGFVKGRCKSTKFFLQNIKKEQDHHELIEIGNELVFSLLSKNTQDTLFWLQWIFTWEKVNKKKKVNLCSPRRITNINPKFESDVSWFIWTIIIALSSKEDSIMSLFYLYSYDYNHSKKNSKIFLIVASCLFVIEKCDHSIPLSYNKIQVQKGVDNIGYLYKEINNAANPNANIIPPMTNFSTSTINNNTKISKPKKKKKEVDNQETEDSLEKLRLVDQIFNSAFKI